MNEVKKKVLFIGSFEHQKTGNTGGQLFACRSLIDSALSDYIEWTLIDSTADSNIKTSRFKRLYKSLIRILKFLYFISTKRIDTVIAFSSNGASLMEKGLYMVIGKLLHKKTILAPRSGYIIEDLRNKKLKNLIHHIFESSDYVICQSNEWANIFNSFYPSPNKYTIVKNWINTEVYSTLSNQNRDYSIYNFLFMAWVERNKGIYEVLDAAEHFNQANKSVKFTIAGHGKDFKKIEQLIQEKKLSNIELLGWVNFEQKLKILSKNNYFLLPTHYEGSPNSLKEAMLSGLIPISTPVGSIPEIIMNNENGFLIEPGNTQQLIEIITKLISQELPLKAIAQEAKNTIANNHSIEVAIQKFKQML